MSNESEFALTEAFNQIDELRKAVVGLEKAYLLLEKSDHADTLPLEAELLDGLRSVLERLKLMDSLLVGDLKKHLPDPKRREVELPSGGAVEIKTGVPTKSWDKKTLIPIVIEKVIEEAMDPATGVIETPYSQLLARVLDFVSFSTFKLTALREVGINPDLYCEAGEPRVSAQFKR